MRWSAKQLRWLTLGGAMLLAVVLAAFLGLAKYRAGRIWQRILKRNGVNLVQESNGITYSQSVGGRTVFTLHAERSTPHGNGTYSLHNAVLILYGKDGRNDRIHGNEFEYDQNQGILRAVGEVHMDLQAPSPARSAGQQAPVKNFSFAPDDEAAADPGVIHVLTSELVYSRKLNVAATKAAVEFSYRGMRCESAGAEFDSGQSTLHLLAQVHLTGTLRQAPFTLAATHADLDRRGNTIALLSPDWASGDRTARADHALLYLRKDGSLQTADGQGGVVMRAQARILSAAAVHAQFGPEGKPQNSVFTGGVQFAEETPGQDLHGSAGTLTLSANAEGVLTGAEADGAVQMREDGKSPQGPTAHRDLRAQHATAVFLPESGQKQAILQHLHLKGGAQLVSVSAGVGSSESSALKRPARLQGVAAGVPSADAGSRTDIRADDLLTTFVPGEGHHLQAQHLVGTGHTVLSETGNEGQRQLSEGDALDVHFAPARAAPQGVGKAESGASTEVSTAVQTGHVVLHSWPGTAAASRPAAGAVAGTALANAPASQPSVGHAQRAVYEASAGTLTLSAEGGARAEVDDGSTQMQAPEIVLHQGTGDGDARGGVAVSTPGTSGSPATHVLAARARLVHALNTAEFFGTDREPAQMWQGTSQVTAADLLLDARRHTLTARPGTAGGLVHGVFASEPAKKDETRPGKNDVAAIGGASTARAGGTSAESPEPPRGVRSGGRGQASGEANLEVANRRQTEASGDAVRVAAEALDYSDLQHEASFHGHVALRGPEGTLTGERGVAFLDAPVSAPGKGNASSEGTGAPAAAPGVLAAAPGMGGRLQRFVLLGDVGLVQPGRTGHGQQLTYTADTNRFVLTGAPGVPPRVVDAQQGTVSGETLVFGAADRSVIVNTTVPEGKPAGKALPGGRVHTETDIKR